MYDGLNKGIRMATGEVIGFLHADDIYAAKTVIEKVANVMNQSKVDSCYGELLSVDKDNTERTIRYWNSGEFSYALLRQGWMPPHPTFFVKREVYERAGVFDTSYKIAADYELMLKFLGKYKITTCYIPEVLLRKNLSKLPRTDGGAGGAGGGQGNAPRQKPPFPDQHGAVLVNRRLCHPNVFMTLWQ